MGVIRSRLLSQAYGPVCLLDMNFRSHLKKDLIYGGYKVEITNNLRPFVTA